MVTSIIPDVLVWMELTMRGGMWFPLFKIWNDDFTWVET